MVLKKSADWRRCCRSYNKAELKLYRKRRWKNPLLEDWVISATQLNLKLLRHRVTQCDIVREKDLMRNFRSMQLVARTRCKKYPAECWLHPCKICKVGLECRRWSRQRSMSGRICSMCKGGIGFVVIYELLAVVAHEVCDSG
jgi:hypothetical protein